MGAFSTKLKLDPFIPERVFLGGNKDFHEWRSEGSYHFNSAAKKCVVSSEDVEDLGGDMCDGQSTPGKFCKVKCLPEYTPTHPQIFCGLHGRFFPSLKLVRCEAEIPCNAYDTSLANIKHVWDPPCKEGSNIASRSNCTTHCEDGYKPSEESLTCTRGKFSPSKFKCKRKNLITGDIYG